MGTNLYARRRLTLGITLVPVAFAAVWGTGVFGELSSGDNLTPPAGPFSPKAERAVAKVTAARWALGLPVQ